MTDFFQHQDNARGRTRLLVALFLLTVVLMIALVYVLAGSFTRWEGGWWNPSLLLRSGGIAGGIILAGSGFKMLQLSAGGSVVARELGGRQIDHSTSDPDERKLLNIVEEMALASGMPFPQVWVMDREAGINAFAAGKSVSDAVIGVTRGCILALDRDELQGVIAHEFSHILNGDMRLNLRLIGIVHGVLVIALVGEGIMRIGSRMRGDSKSPGPVLVVIGIAIMAIGWLGVLLGRLIKSAISRQREFLADASAVQFTRNPDGIGRALIKIGGYDHGSTVGHGRAKEASHMMFGSIKVGLFDSHPPLALRIKAVLPGWNGKFTPLKLPEIRADMERVRPILERQPKRAIADFSQAVAPFHVRPTRERHPNRALWDTGAVIPAVAEQIVSRVGQMTPADIEGAARFRAGLSLELRELLNDPSGAQAVMFGLLLGTEAETAALSNGVDDATLQTASQIAAEVQQWHSSHAISLVDLAIPALRRLSREEYLRFNRIVDSILKADRQIDLFEFMVQRVLRRHLDLWFDHAGPPRVKFHSLQQIAPQLEIILSAISDVGRRTPEEGAAALAAGQQFLAEQGVYLNLRTRATGLDEVDAALTKFDAATPLLKKQLIMACTIVAREDGTITDGEAELLRAVADSIGCPMPRLHSGLTA